MRGPLLFRVAWAITWTFRQRRQVYRWWIVWDCSPAVGAARSCAYWCRHPVLYFDVRRRVRILQSGRDYIEA